MGFKSDLEFGKIYENKFKNDFLGGEGNIIEGYCLEYDIVCKDLKYEVKADRLAHKTGNFFIEYECNGKKSGIASSTAHFWALYNVFDNEKLYLVPSRVLRKMIRNKEYERIGFCYPKNKGYLIKVEKLKKYLIK